MRLPRIPEGYRYVGARFLPDPRPIFFAPGDTFADCRIPVLDALQRTGGISVGRGDLVWTCVAYGTTADPRSVFVDLVPLGPVEFLRALPYELRGAARTGDVEAVAVLRTYREAAIEQGSDPTPWSLEPSVPPSTLRGRS